MTAWKWSVDGVRVPATTPKAKRKRASQCGLSDDSPSDVRAAIREHVAAVEDITIPDLSLFGAVLTPAQEPIAVAYRVRVRDQWRARIEALEQVA